MAVLNTGNTSLTSDQLEPVNNVVQFPSASAAKGVMIVEDEADAREIFTDLLKSANYRVVSAVDGVDALAKLEADKGKIDIILLDIIMPNKDGVETLENIVDNPERYGKPRVVMLTNIGGDAAVEKALQIGALGYMLKSETEPEQLLKSVQQYLNMEVTPAAPTLAAA
jgi:CheY-like chemotaxis protein